MTDPVEHEPTIASLTANQRRWPHRTLACLGAALVAVVAFWAARVDNPMAWFHRPQPSPQQSSAPADPVQHAVTAEPAPRELPGTDSSVSSVPLPLILTATFPGRNATEGRALIGVDYTNPQTFAAGALLSNGARLVEIHRDRVILERAGRRAALMLTGSEAAATAALDRRASGALELVMAGGAQAARASEPLSASSFTDVLVPSPVYDANGSVAGFEVHAGKDRAAFARLGLQPGDVIEAIDGMPLNDLPSAAEALRWLGDGYVVSAQIRRKRDRLHVSLDGAMFIEAKGQGRTPMVVAEATVPPT